MECMYLWSINEDRRSCQIDIIRSSMDSYTLEGGVVEREPKQIWYWKLGNQKNMGGQKMGLDNLYEFKEDRTFL